MTYEEAKEELVEVYCQFDSCCPYRKGMDCDTICSYGKAIEALEKQIPKKPKEMLFSDTGICQCGTFVTENETYCCVCGQAIDWSE